MTPEQKDKLLTRHNLLIDELIIEADPTKFADLHTRDGRGDRQWQKTNAIKTATLIMRIEELVGMRRFGVPAVPKEGDEDGDAAGASAGSADVDKLIAEAGAKVARISGGKKQSGKKG